MSLPPVYKGNRGSDLAEDGQRESDQSTNDHADLPPYSCDNRRTLGSRSPPAGHTAKSQRRTTYPSNDKHDMDAGVCNLETERRTPRRGVHGEQDDNRTPSSIQLPEYRDGRDSSITHFGVIGTHDGKTFIPKCSVHRTALDDLAYPYNEDRDYFMLDVNLDGDQIDHLLHSSEIYNAGDQRNAYQNSTTS